MVDHEGREGRLTMLGAGLVFLLFFSLAVYPVWPYSRGWGYGPSGVLGAVLVVVVVLFLMGRV